MINRTISKEQALKNAIASVEMEGYRLSEFNKNLCKDVLDGKLTKQQCIEKILRKEM